MAKDTTEYAKSVADLKKINDIVMPLLNALARAGQVLDSARKAAADTEIWAKEVADLDAVCTELATKEAEFTRRKEAAEALVAPAERDAERRVTEAAHYAHSQIAAIQKSVSDQEASARENKERLAAELAAMVKEISERRSEAEVAHASRMAEMAVDIAEGQKKLDAITKAIDNLKKKF